ncbi:MAG: hypothetical protein KF692_00110 [Cryobacterium sp.]|nr:hypothetical protein [Cryobacterium sp.]
MNANNATPDDKDAEENAEAVAAEDAAENTPADEAAADEVVTESPTEDAEAAVGSEASVDEAATPAQTGEVAPAPVQTVYVTAPTPPKRKGNRGMGTLLAFVAAIVFAAAYAGFAAVLYLVVTPGQFSGAIVHFVSNPLYFVPVLAFLVIMILWALLVNRASWWAWVIGSLVVAAVTYFASIGALLLMAGGFGLTANQAATQFQDLAISPALIAAGLLARETSIWFGAAIARRGRRVRERNYEAWQAFENEEARKRAEFGGVAAV